MRERSLHVVAFDIPVPVNYGGAIDIFYKLEYLKKAGVKVILHCFQYGGREKADILEKMCEKVYYYPRKFGLFKLISPLPYIVSTRMSAELEFNLLKDNNPILFEGIHTTYLLSDPRFLSRKKYVRMHNVEYDYYKGLARSERSMLKKMFFYIEAHKLYRYEKKLRNASMVITISKNDKEYYERKGMVSERVSAFHPDRKVEVKKGVGDYVLYHGSLDVSENEKVAMYLVNEVFNTPGIPFFIAGNKPSSTLVNACKDKSHIRLLTNLSDSDFVELVSGAQVNVLPTFQPTGIKLKLLLALHRGRHVVVNSNMVKNTGLESLCVIADDSAEIRHQCECLLGVEFSESEIQRRGDVLSQEGFLNEGNIEKLIQLLF